jgi:hypothetical protein
MRRAGVEYNVALSFERPSAPAEVFGGRRRHTLVSRTLENDRGGQASIEVIDGREVAAVIGYGLSPIGR